MSRRPGPRDSRGWRIPQAGTRSREVYELTVAGQDRSAIADALGMTPGNVGVLKWKFTNPENANARANGKTREDWAEV